MFCHVPIQVNQDGLMLRFICVFLACDLPIQLLLNLLRTYHDRLVDGFHLILIPITNYEICIQHFVLEQIDMHIFLPVVYQYSCFYV